MRKDTVLENCVVRQGLRMLHLVSRRESCDLRRDLTGRKVAGVKALGMGVLLVSARECLYDQSLVSEKGSWV